MSDTGWHRHDNGLVHRDDAECTWLGNPVPVPAPDCVCGAPMWSEACRTRAHLRGPVPQIGSGDDA